MPSSIFMTPMTPRSSRARCQDIGGVWPRQTRSVAGLRQHTCRAFRQILRCSLTVPKKIGHKSRTRPSSSPTADVWNSLKQCRCIATQTCCSRFGESVCWGALKSQTCRCGIPCLILLVETWAVCPITCPCLRGRLPRRTSSLRHRQHPLQRRSTIVGARSCAIQSFSTTWTPKSWFLQGAGRSHLGEKGHSAFFGSLCETGRHDVSMLWAAWSGPRTFADMIVEWIMRVVSSGSVSCVIDQTVHVLLQAVSRSQKEGPAQEREVSHRNHCSRFDSGDTARSAESADRRPDHLCDG
mmetsp:Transcript_54955/g.146730  ORF Transcript_54955/g.146730 Transcript_54955/m.146730 type:complete len:296 (+) Transcript_54955:222-1109(+)